MHCVAPTEKDSANQTLKKGLWTAADQAHTNSGLKTGHYSSPIFGLIFLRFIEARFSRRCVCVTPFALRGRGRR